MNEFTEDNPLLSTCKCNGTMQYLHYRCLKEWLSKKMTHKKTANLSSFYWKTFECEICKTAYPCIISSLFKPLVVMRCNNKIFQLVEIDRPEGNYMILESLNLDKNSSRMIHVIVANSSRKTFRLVSPLLISYREEATILM